MSLVDRLNGRAQFCFDRGEIKSPELMRQAARRIAELEAENARMQRYEFALKVIADLSPSVCPFDYGPGPKWTPEKPCYVCGAKGDFESQAACVGNPPRSIARAALGAAK